MTNKHLEDSIIVWKNRTKLTTFEEVMQSNLGASGCPLCHAYNKVYLELEINVSYDDMCAGCPIAENNPDNVECQGTPYEHAAAYFLWKAQSSGAEGFTTEKWQELAQAEVNFLISLRGLPTTQDTEEEIENE